VALVELVTAGGTPVRPPPAFLPLPSRTSRAATNPGPVGEITESLGIWTLVSPKQRLPKRIRRPTSTLAVEEVVLTTSISLVIALPQLGLQLGYEPGGRKSKHGAMV